MKRMAVRRGISPAKLFEELGVNTEAPGFCDDPRFIEAEQAYPRLLEEYAAFIRSKRYSVDYLEKARTVVRAAAIFLYERLIEDGRTGACIDVSMVLSRFLDQQSVWNYINSGALSVTFDKATGMRPVRYAPVTFPDNPATAGHTWLYAPPFQIVDITVSVQTYESNEAQYIPRYVIMRKAKRSPFDAIDLMDPDCVAQFRHANGLIPVALSKVTLSVPLPSSFTNG